jgi:hypothetical protein
MILFDYITIFVSFFLFNPLNSIILGYPIDQSGQIHEGADLDKSRLQAILHERKRRLGSDWLHPIYLGAFSLLPYVFIKWDMLDPANLLWSFLVVPGCIVVWTCSTQDIDLATGRSLLKERIILVFSFLGFLAYPGFIVIFLYTAINYLNGWNKHQKLVLQIFQMTAAYTASVALVRSGMVLLSLPEVRLNAVSLLFLIICMYATPFIYAGLAKFSVGKRWYSWIRSNRLHYLGVIAYSRGWLRFYSEERVLRLLQFFSQADRVFQAAITAIECSWLFALFSLPFCCCLLILTILFESFLSLFTGIIFWQSIVMQGALCILLMNLSVKTEHVLFNVMNGLIGLLLLLTISWSKKSGYQSYLLTSLWNTPFIGRICWYLRGKSGKTYFLANSFMNPHDTAFGSTYGRFLIDRKIISSHLGAVRSMKLRNAIVETQGDKAELDALAAKAGKNYYDPVKETIHDRHLNRFFFNFNRGESKRVCPKFLRAPGMIFFNWDALESFEGQEPISTVIVTWREDFYDGNKICQVREDWIKDIHIENFKEFEEEVLSEPTDLIV